MAHKLTCPHCDVHTSAVWRAYNGLDQFATNFDPDATFLCPHCGGDLSGPEIAKQDALLEWT